MKITLKRKVTINTDDNLILLIDKKSNIDFLNLSKPENKFLQTQLKNKKELIYINQYNRWIQFICPKKISSSNLHLENCRLLGNKSLNNIATAKSLLIIDIKNNQKEILAITEGLALGSYSFNNRKTKKENTGLNTIFLCQKSKKSDVAELQNVVNSVFLCRDLVNEPFSHLKAKELAAAAKKASKDAGFKIETLNKQKIKQLKMGGLLAVNQGSLDPPNFSILTWKPKNAKNKQPIILVGKGIVYDTGGLSLKPTKGMDIMKVDMGGAGCVIGAMHAIAINNLPINVIGLVPATDNRPSGNAYAPGDVVKMHSGTTVEVLNTDAEGRMILADALSFAKKYNPKIVIDLATLTGAAARAIGHYGIVSMHQKAEKEHLRLKEVGDNVHERLAEMPFWEDYNKLIKSDVADIKNIGGPEAGAITAGKFLAYFTDYPWIHLDIAGPTYVTTRYGYRGKGATGTGDSLLYEFVKSYC